MKHHSVIALPLLLVLAAFAGGCGANVEPPEPYSVRELKSSALVYLEEVEQTLARKGHITLAQTRRLATHLNWLRRHMETTGVGTPNQRRALEEALNGLSGTVGRPGPPADWRPGDEDPPEPIVKAGPIRDLLPQIRDILESVPDSDERPRFD